MLKGEKPKGQSDKKLSQGDQLNRNRSLAPSAMTLFLLRCAKGQQSILLSSLKASYSGYKVTPKIPQREIPGGKLGNFLCMRDCISFFSVEVVKKVHPTSLRGSRILLSSPPDFSLLGIFSAP